MRFEKLNPPGTFCQLEAIKEMVLASGGKTFLEVGCGDGSLSNVLLESGLDGAGVELSSAAAEIAKTQLNKYIEQGRYEVLSGDIYDLSPPQADVVVSMMVMEHIEDDLSFMKRLNKFVKPGGSLVVVVPGRKDHWCLEDELVGHFRRYERFELSDIMNKCGLEQIKVWSASVPVANILFKVSNFLTSRTAAEKNKSSLSKQEQTLTSGIREIPFKTVFPSFFKLILNRNTLYPLLVLQRFFYNTDLGITLIASGRVGS